LPSGTRSDTAVHYFTAHSRFRLKAAKAQELDLASQKKVLEKQWDRKLGFSYGTA